MSKKVIQPRTCDICGQTFPENQLIPGAVVRDTVAEVILREHTGWSHESLICRRDLNRFRAKYVRGLLESEKGELTSLEHDVIHSLHDQVTLARDVEATFEQEWSFSERLADRIAAFGGSWTFLSCFGALLAFWIGMNSVVWIVRPVDPYPFILLNLILSCLAAVQAPIIMMSQRRQEAKDRLRSQHDYQVNLKAEFEIRQLHEKLDHLLTHQWGRLTEIQQIQLDLLSEIGRTDDA